MHAWEETCFLLLDAGKRMRPFKIAESWKFSRWEVSKTQLELERILRGDDMSRLIMFRLNLNRISLKAG